MQVDRIQAGKAPYPPARDGMFSDKGLNEFLGRDVGPEARLLLCCTRVELSPEMVGRISTLANLPLNWNTLCDSAEKHRVTQLLFRNLSAACPEAIPAAVQKRLRHQFFSNAGFNLKLAHALVSLLRAFGAEGIVAIPFKGSVLANCTYGQLSLRQNYDIDLFIGEQDIEDSQRVLESKGYECDEVFDRELRYRRVDDGIELDLHWGFAPRFFHHTVDWDGLSRRAQAASVLGHTVSTFSAEDLLLILCLQVVKDCWERRQQLEHLSKVCDIAEHLRANPGLDWAWVVREARQDGQRRILHCGLTLARELLGADLPPDVSRAVRSDTKARRCARNMCLALFTEADTLSPLDNPLFSPVLRLRQLHFYLGVRERRREQIRHLAEILRLAGPGKLPDKAVSTRSKHKKETSDGIDRQI